MHQSNTWKGYICWLKNATILIFDGLCISTICHYRVQKTRLAGCLWELLLEELVPDSEEGEGQATTEEEDEVGSQLVPAQQTFHQNY